MARKKSLNAQDLLAVANGDPSDQVVVKLMGSLQTVLLPKERAAEYLESCRQHLWDLRPASAAEETLVAEIVMHKFLYSRYARMSNYLENAMPPPWRYLESLDKLQAKCVADLRAVERQLQSVQARRRETAIAAALSQPDQSQLVH